MRYKIHKHVRCHRLAHIKIIAYLWPNLARIAEIGKNRKILEKRFFVSQYFDAFNEFRT